MSLPRFPLLAAVCVLSCMACLSGCRSDYSPSFEAFSRNKLAVLGRNMETTRDAQKAASETITEAVATIKREAWTGADPIEAYNVARRADAASDSRVREAHRRLTTLQTSAEDFFRKWTVENTEYEDSKLKESSRQNRSKVKAQFDDAIAAMKRADGFTQPALDALQDQVLFLKHHRNFATVPERPANSSDPAKPAEALAKLTEAAAAKATEVAASVRPK